MSDAVPGLLKNLWINSSAFLRILFWIFSSNNIFFNSFSTSSYSEIIKTDLVNELIYLKGSIPGARNSQVLLKKAIKNINKLTIKEKIENLEKLKKAKDKKK